VGDVSKFLVEHSLPGNAVDSGNICILSGEKIMKRFFYACHCLMSFCNGMGESEFKISTLFSASRHNSCAYSIRFPAGPQLKINSFGSQIFWVRFILTGGK